ncbi:MAG: hypothetical protein R3Y38_06460 [Rikenellaceae bacterium]
MEKQSLSKFLLMQFALLLLVVVAIPEFSLPSVTSGALFSSFLSFLVLISAVVFYVIALLFFNKKASAAGSKLDLKFMICSALGALMVLYANLPELQSSAQAYAEDIVIDAIVSVVGLALLVYSFVISSKTLGCSFTSVPAKGSYVILMSILVRTFNSMSDSWLVGIAALVALFIYWKSLTKLTEGTDEAISAGVSKLKTAIILSLVAVVVGWIPVLGWIAAPILMIIAFVMELMAYGKFTASTSFGELGQKGARKLKTSMILYIVGAGLSIIPFLGSILDSILCIVAFVLVFLGWKGIILGFEEKSKA